MKINHILVFLVIIFFTLFSCTDKNLEERISELELINEQLLDSLRKYEYNEILSYKMYLYSDNDNFVIGEKKTIYGAFLKYDYLRSYDVYYETKDSLILKNQSFSKFQFDFTPKSENDTIIRATALFDMSDIEKTTQFHIPGELIIKPIKP